MHTLRVEGGRVERMFYTPLLDRERGTLVEVLVEVPPAGAARGEVDGGGGKVEVSFEFEKAGLRYTEYPPDANRGFDVPPAVIRVLPDEHSEHNKHHEDGEAYSRQGSYLRTTSLLLPLPTPDFSMPYNVIILTSTVIALGFGSIFNLLVRRFVLVEEVPAAPLAGVVGRVRGRIGGLVGRFRGAKVEVKDGGMDGDVKGAERGGGGKEGGKAANGRPKGERKKDR